MKTNRQSKIIEIIQKNEVETQDEPVSYTHLTLPTIA